MDKETRIDSSPDNPTIKDVAADAETHQLDPRYWAPLLVCPQCSLAWETDAGWCPSCGTAFERAATESSPPRRARSRTSGAANRGNRSSSTTRNTGERAAAHPPAPRRAGKAGRGSRGLAIAACLLLVPAAALGFLAGQQSRPSQAEVDRQTAKAVDQAKLSAFHSFQRNFAKQRAKLQAEVERRAAAAAAQGFAQGKANAEQEAQQQAGDFTDNIKQCIDSLFTDC
ncbi:MAG: hypothetical protein ACRDKI_05595 [Solirubrobacterales bacterium]